MTPKYRIDRAKPRGKTVTESLRQNSCTRAQTTLLNQLHSSLEKFEIVVNIESNLKRVVEDISESIFEDDPNI